MKRRKRDIVWGIRQYGTFLPFLCASTRKDAIKKCNEHRGWDRPVRTWRQSRRIGYTVHKMEVRDV